MGTELEQGVIPLDSLSGDFDLQSTVESGQSYTWSREDGRMYEETPAYGGDAWYYTVLSGPMDLNRNRERDQNGNSVGDSDWEGDGVGDTDTKPVVIRVRQHDGQLEWESSIDAHASLVHLLRLDDALDAIMAEAPDDPLVQAAYDAYHGMRLVRDPPFSSLISFICSAQMRVSRIHNMQRVLASEFGNTVEFDGSTYHAFPTPEQLATATESDLRALKLGYRAPYVVRTAEMVARDGVHPEDALGMGYEKAREYLTRFVGVGEKVADCVLLFSLDYLEAVPLDTWIRGAIDEHFPDCERGNYTETSRAIRKRFGPEYAGYTQTYVFHYLRTNEFD
jgi:N-glycosylase/DNA lyase